MKRREIRKFQSYFTKLADCRRAGGSERSCAPRAAAEEAREAASAERG